MNNAQKKAYFFLVGFGLNLIAGVVLACFLPTEVRGNAEFLGLGVYQIQAYGAWLGVFCLVIAVGDFLYRKRSGDIVDERDQHISEKANASAYAAFWVAFAAACAGMVLVFGPLKISFPAVWVVGPLLIGGIVVFTSAHSIAILIQYGWGGCDE